MRTGQAVVIEDLRRRRRPARSRASSSRAGLRAVLAVPVRRGAWKCSGALLFASRAPAAYGPDDLQVAAVIAAGLGSALESARAYQALADERSTLAAVLGSTSDAVVMLNDDGVVLLANPAVGPMLGLLPDAMVGPVAAARSRATSLSVSSSSSPARGRSSSRSRKVAPPRRASSPSSRRTASPWAWPRSCATSRCSSTWIG